MSKLEELIQQYCPEGVEYRPLGAICSNLLKGTLTTKELVEPDGQNYPVVNSGRELYGYYPQFNNEGDAFTVASRGEYAGYITYFDERFWAGGLCYPYRSNTSEISTKFIFYFLKSKQEYIRYSLVAEGSIPALNKGTLELFEIPIPPLPVQEEIVRILDTFTELQTELQTELEKRKEQYNYYRDNLLSFEGRTDVEWKKLGEICSVMRGKRLTKSQLSSEGKYKVFHGGIDPIGFYGEFNREGDTTMVINVGASAGTLGFSKERFWSSDGCFCLSHTTALLGRFVFYYLQTKEPYLMSRVRRAGIPTLDGKVLEDISFPILSLSEQQRIVSILDRFDALTNDLTAGLPAEIEKRRQQYEYYRDKLLTFKRKES